MLGPAQVEAGAPAQRLRAERRPRGLPAHARVAAGALVLIAWHGHEEDALPDSRGFALRVLHLAVAVVDWEQLSYARLWLLLPKDAGARLGSRGVVP